MDSSRTEVSLSDRNNFGHIPHDRAHKLSRALKLDKQEQRS